MIGRAVRAGPGAVAAVALLIVSRAPVAPLAVLLALLVSVVTRWRAPLDRATSRLAVAVVAILVVAGVRAADFVMTDSGMRALAFGVALAPLAVLAMRHLVLAPEGGLPVDVALSFVSLLACGAARPGWVYVALVCAFVASVTVAARAEQGGRPERSELSTRSVLVGAGVVVGAVCAVAAFAAAAPPVARGLEARFNRLMRDRWLSRTGFNDSVRFGHVTRLLGSRRVVMRLSGPPVTHLRGVALERYDDERWSGPVTEELLEVQVPVARPPGGDVVEVRAARAELDRLFVPLDARELATPSGAVRVDALGALRPRSTERASTLWFRVGPRDVGPVAPPRARDLEVPAALREPLSALAREWVPAGASRAQALSAIQRHLLDGYSYSADYTRRTRLDAVAEFLFVSKLGHCEAFASAMALVARSAGVPARLVVGYRVGERNPVFSHWVVRDSNAHAWVEAADDDGAWRTYDPTPMGELPQDLAHDEAGVDAVAESLATLWSRAEGWLSERSVVELGGAAVVGLVLFAGLRLRRRGRGAADSTRVTVGFSRPLVAFVALERVAASRGVGREPAETLERWSSRLPGFVADAVRAYAAHRYGAVSDEAAVVALLTRARASFERGRSAATGRGTDSQD